MDFDLLKNTDSLTIEELSGMISMASKKVEELKSEGKIASLSEAKKLQDMIKKASAVLDDAKEVLVEPEVEVAEEVETETVEEVETVEAVAETVEVEVDTVLEEKEQITAPVETNVVEAKEAVTASLNNVREIQSRFNGVDVKTASITFDVNPDADVTGLSAEETTKRIASIMTPSFAGLSKVQKSFGVKTAASCEPGEVLRQAYSCGTYNSTIAGLFRTVATNSMKVVWHGNFDASAAVAEVDLTANPILKDCEEYVCNPANEKELEEVSACFTLNEQIKFSSDLALETLVSEANSFLAAKIDSMLIQEIDAYSHPFAYAGTGAGYGDVAVGVAAVFGRLEEVTPLTGTDAYAVLVPRSMLGYIGADNYARQNSWSPDSAVGELFGGRRVVAFDDFIDPTHTPVALPALGGAAETVAVRPDYVVRLINPDSAFHIVRNENQYGLQPVAPSIDELRGNKSSYFARAYTALGLLQDCGWATIDFTGLCVGGRVNSTATCIA